MKNKNMLIGLGAIVISLSLLFNVITLINIGNFKTEWRVYREFKIEDKLTEKNEEYNNLGMINVKIMSLERTIGGLNLEVKRLREKVVENIQENSVEVEESPFINVSQLARILEVDPSAIVDSKDKLPHLIVEGKVMFNKEKVIEFLSENKIELISENFTPKQAAEYLKVSVNDIYNLINDTDSGFPFVNALGYYRINTEELKKWKNSNQNN